MKKKAPVSVRTIDFNSPNDLEWFRKAVEADRARILKNPELARQNLIDSGIYTPTGRLSKHYK